ncbi:MAG: TIGR04283 family arsenosugar biosynthesis glycosyltransferase [Acidobacteria bacterium]|nr:TIGR04283 family arsenosugar biosynthesis glycosyltransferase [Acidobacteriota bacterium]
MFLTIVVPVLADTAAAQQLLGQIEPDADVEVIVVDGGSDERLAQLIEGRPHARFLRTSPGRARQMNAGAACASGEWLLFLHADSTLPAEWRRAIAEVDSGAVGGWFRFALDDPAWQARAIERLVAWRVRWLRLPYGDQGLFVRRRVFDALGGFRELPLLEDVDWVRRLRRAGPVAELPLPLRTSARRWRRDGWFRRSAWNLVIVALYFLGLSPTRLSRWYV